jgi:hypothetical protein
MTLLIVARADPICISSIEHPFSSEAIVPPRIRQPAHLPGAIMTVPAPAVIPVSGIDGICQLPPRICNRFVYKQQASA